jgi:molybdenum-dependent DNA-binding transcriptional regulator ModE
MLEKKDAMSAIASYRMESTLRGVDLNLLTVFDAVMQEQNITRAAHNLGMSQPAVSNAVARLKVMFNDELFMRQGRGIQPTQRLANCLAQSAKLYNLFVTNYQAQCSNLSLRLVYLNWRFVARVICDSHLKLWRALMNKLQAYNFIWTQSLIAFYLSVCATKKSIL